MLEHFESHQTVPVAGYQWSGDTGATSDRKAGSPGDADWGPLVYLDPQGKDRRDYDVFRDEPALFLQLAATPPSADAILDFADSYGRLWDDERGPSLPSWRGSLEDLHAAVQLWQAIKGGSSVKIESCLERHAPLWLRRSRARRNYAMLDKIKQLRILAARPGSHRGLRQAAQPLLAALLESKLRCLVRLKAGMSTHGAVEIRVSVDRLLDAAWIQFTLAVVHDEDFRPCHFCGRPMKITPAANRADRIFCSTRCRVAAHRAKKTDEAGTAGKEPGGKMADKEWRGSTAKNKRKGKD